MSLKLDAEQLTDAQFEHKYQASKKQYGMIKQAIRLLGEIHDDFQDPGKLEVEYEIVRAVDYLIRDFETLIDEMKLSADFAMEMEPDKE